jgi:DNA-binding XRE family transcriptional regulator
LGVKRVTYAVDIATVLRTWRARHGLSQRAAARALDVPRETYRKWEAGAQHPSPEGPLRIAVRHVLRKR